MRAMRNWSFISAGLTNIRDEYRQRDRSLQVYGYFRIFTEIEYNIRTKYQEIRKNSAIMRAWQV